MKTINSKRGITLMELMVVIAIMGVLSTIAVPKFFGAGEKAREKIDLMKLYDLRNAINLALIEDTDALNNYTPVKGDADRKKTNQNNLSKALMSNSGASIFVIELHNKLTLNVQGTHRTLNSSYNVCEMVGSSGTLYTALKDANFEGVADIIAARLKGGNNYKKDGETFTSKEYKNSSGGTDYRTAPKKQLFQSRALNLGKENDNTRYTVNVRWSDPDSPGYSVEVFLLPKDGAWNTAYLSDNGTCFSTYGRKGCSKK